MECSTEGCDEEFDSSRALSVHESWCEDARGEMKKEYSCEYCNNTFESYESKDSGDGVKNRFCSTECKDSFEGSDGLDTKCSECGCEVHIPPSQVDEIGGYEQKNHFCNKECESSFKSREWVGEGHPSWEGGSPSHRGKSWIKMRRKAIKRDDKECQVCGMTRKQHHNKYGQDLDVHHKIPSKEFDNVDDSNYLINLVTTCRSCHGQLDKISRREANRKPSISNK